MDIGDVKLAIGIDVQILAGIVSGAYEDGTIPATFTDPDTGAVVTIEKPTIEVDDPAGTPQLVLHAVGTFALGPSPAPLDARIELVPFVRAVAGEASVGAFRVGAIIAVSPALLAGILGPLAADLLDPVLANFDIPLFDPLIGQIEASFFGDSPPGRDTWSASFTLGSTSTIDRVQVGFPPGQPDQPMETGRTALNTSSALTATIALPGETAAIPGGGSIVPEAKGIQILIGRSTMDAMLAAQAAAKVGTDVEGAEITQLSMEMHDLGIRIDGRAEKDPATIDWDGILLIFFRNRFQYSTSGRIRWSDGYVDVFTSGIDVEVDIPWWVTLLRVLGAVFLGPIGWVLDATLVQPKLDEADEAPDLVRGAFRDEVTDALAAAASISGVGDGASIMTFGHDAWVLDGHYTTTLVAFAGITDTTIDAITLDEFEVTGAHGSSVGLLEIGTGHTLHPEELGRLMKAGLVRIPGHHGVEAEYGFYVRTNPNQDTTDNLVDPATILTI